LVAYYFHERLWMRVEWGKLFVSNNRN
jgi:uncharacterized membrane protein